MLKKEEIQNPNAIEEYFCKPLNEFKPTGMNVDQMEIMIAIGFVKDENVADMEMDFQSVYWFYPAIEKRINACFTYTMDAKAKMLLATWCNSIGEMVMYLTLLQFKCKQKGLKTLNFDALALMFADGIINRDFMYEVWQKQKVEPDGYGGSDNLIDYASASLSIQF